jgi:hypothetical protein
MREISKLLAVRRNGVNMNNEKKSCCNQGNVIEGISCDVRTCAYHMGSDKCAAGHIKVGPNQAEVSRETLCTTFKNRTE